MSKLSALALVLTALSACTDREITTPPGSPETPAIAFATCGAAETLDLEEVLLPEVTEHAPLSDPAPTGWQAELGRPVIDDHDALCGCADDDCVVDWVADTFGCGVCASTMCDGDLIGACVACEPDAIRGAVACIVAAPDERALD